MGLSSNAPVTLTVVTSRAEANGRSFSIKITQIDCLSYSRGIKYLLVLNIIDLKSFKLFCFSDTKNKF